MSLLFVEPTQLWLDIPEAVRTASWRDSQACATPASRWNAYVHQLCLTTLHHWLREECALNARPLLTDMWEWVGGAAIALSLPPHEVRLVLVPTEVTDEAELRVPQEWMDLPSWAGDYYLAVQVCLDEGWIRVWGYATYAQLKAQGVYDNSDRTYSLDGDDLGRNLNALWVTLELCPEVLRQAIAPMPALTPTRADALIARLGNIAVAMPRLAVPFGDWGAILEQADWRQRLCALRRGTSPTILANLATWLADRVEAQSFEATGGWQPIETLFPNYRTLATGLRRTRNLSDRVRRVKLLHFGAPPERTDMVLSVEVAAEPDNRLGIRVQLHPGGETPYLPEQTVLSLLGKDEAVLQSVQARSQDNFIQIQRFKCPPGTPFSLRVEWSGQSIVEAFTS